MARVTDFLMTNIRTIGLIYVIGAGITLIAVLLFFWLICRAEDKERELYPDDYFYSDETNKAAGTAATMCIALFVGIGCAILWVAIPLLFFGVWIYTEIAERFPELMGNMVDDDDEREMEE